jgi:2-polyprenyl-6-hydroxyphenyl methylase / 3-demethylubiquinone-9 3-methyltransferase
MTQFTNTDYEEIRKFDNVAKTWWDPSGEMGTLHTINPLRTKFILENLNVSDPAILDVGCGGGILAESLARSGARVTGIDLSEPSLEAARIHAKEQGLNIDYLCQSAEEVAKKHAGGFDVVTCMEMLEHVPAPNKIIAACSRLLKPGGHIFFSTINRNLKSFLYAIVGGEYLLRLLPKGSHTYRRLIRPNELKLLAEENKLEFVRLASLIYNPFNGKFRVVEKEDVNYMVHFVGK